MLPTDFVNDGGDSCVIISFNKIFGISFRGG